MVNSDYKDDFGPAISRRAALRYLTGLAIGGSSGMLWLAGCGKSATPSQSKPLYTYHGHNGPINAIAWSPNGMRIASASEDKTVQLWNATRNDSVLVYRRHTQTVYDVVWSPDGRQLASLSGDETIQIWDAFTGATRFILPIQFSFIEHMNELLWSPDGKYLLFACADITSPTSSEERQTLMWNVWDTTNGRRLIVHRDPPYIVDYRQMSPDQANFLHGLAISPDGARLVTLSDQGSLQVRDIRTGKTLLTFKNSAGHSDRGSIAWSFDNTHVVLCREDPGVLVWDATTGQHTRTYTLGDLQIRKAAWSSDNRYLAGEAWVLSVDSITTHGIVRIWDAISSKNIATYPFDGEMPRGAWSPGSKYIALPNIYVVNVWQLA